MQKPGSRRASDNERKRNAHDSRTRMAAMSKSAQYTRSELNRMMRGNIGKYAGNQTKKKNNWKEMIDNTYRDKYNNIYPNIL